MKIKLDGIERLNKAMINITVSTKQFEAAMKRAHAVMRKHFGELAEQESFLARQAWWKTTGEFPDFVLDENEKEWWEDGGDDPGWSLSA